MTTETPRAAGILADWPNDDLVFKDDTKEHLNALFPKIAPIFIADDLHDFFNNHDWPSITAKKKARKWGKVAILLGLGGIIVAALMPVLLMIFPVVSGPLTKVLSVIVGGLSVSGLAVGYWMALNGKTKRDWMKNRLGTERIRQFHFQSIINNLPIVLEAINTQDFTKWDQVRAKSLARFKNFTNKDTYENLVAVLEDEAQDAVWLEDAWHTSDLLDDDALSAEFMDVWREQRLGVQLRYTRLVLGATGSGMRQRATLIDGLITGLTLGAMIVSLLVAVFYVTDQSDLVLAISQAILAILGGGSIAARAFEEGMNFTAEKDRMEWYLASLQGIEGRLRNAQTSREYIQLMREIERLSYQEMHRFLKTMHEAKFVM